VSAADGVNASLEYEAERNYSIQKSVNIDVRVAKNTLAGESGVAPMI